MSIRLLQNIWRSPYANILIKPRVYCAGNEVINQKQSYATQILKKVALLETKRSAGILAGIGSLKPFPIQHGAVQRFYAGQTNRVARAGTAGPVSIEELLQRLEAYYKQHGYLNYEHCMRIIQVLPTTEQDSTHALTSEQIHFLLGACVPELLPSQTTNQRLDMFQHLWQYISRREQLNISYYLTHLQVLRENRVPLTDFRAFLADAETKLAGDAKELFSMLLDVACATGSMRQATDLLADMRQHNFALNERNFNALLLGHARNGDLAGAQKVLDSMRAAGVALSSETHAIRALGYLENQQTESAMEILREQHEKFEARQLLQLLRATLVAPVEPAVIETLVREFPEAYLNVTEVPAALRSLCIELLHNGKLHVVRLILATLPKPKFNENQNIDSFGVFMLHEMFRARIDITKIVEIADQLRTSGHNARALHLLAEVALRRQPDAVLICFKALEQAGEKLRPHYFWPLILHNVRMQGESGVLQTLCDMSALMVECDDETLRGYVLPNLWVSLEQPQQTLKQLENCGVRPSQVLAPIVLHLLQQQKIDDVLALCEVYPTRMDLFALLTPLAAVAVNARATKRYQRFAKLVAALDKRALDKNNDFVGALLLHMLAAQTRLRSEPTALLKFLHEMSRLELKISRAAAEQIEAAIRRPATAKSDIKEQTDDEADTLSKISQTLQQMRNPNLMLPQDVTHAGGATSFIKHPRDMTRDELECHLVELESKKLNVRGVLRRLLQLSVRDGRLERARELKTKCDTLQVQTSPGMLAAIFDMYIKLKESKLAQETLQELQKKYPGFQIDEHKYIDYAALLVHDEHLDAAKLLLQQRATNQKIMGGDYVIKNVWNLLNEVAQYAAKQGGKMAQQTASSENTTTAPLELPHNLTRDTFTFLRKLGYCNAHNALLGPIVREWLLRGDINAAVKEFARLADQYKHTPLQFELMSLLVRLCNADAKELARYAPLTVEQAQQQLATVTEIVSRVHGIANMNSALLLALAESGTEVQLRRLIINPEFRINHELLIKNCEHLGQEGAVDTLVRLARGVRGMQRVVDEQRIYDMLLSKFVQENDHEAALNLYERLEADDELKVSQTFIRNLVALLRVNNIQIPSNIALRAQII